MVGLCRVRLLVRNREMFGDPAWVPLCAADLVAVGEAGSADVLEIVEKRLVVRTHEIPDARVRAAIGCDNHSTTGCSVLPVSLSRKRVRVDFWRLVKSNSIACVAARGSSGVSLGLISR